MEDIIKNIVEEFFSKMLVDFSNLDVKKELENIYYIKLETTDSSLIIGTRGRNLDDIKNILKILINRKAEENIIIHVEVNDYLKSKEDKLINYIKNKIDYVKETNKDFRLPFFSAYERKKIHSYVSDLKSDIYTKSEGEGKDRRLYICKKNNKMTIDLDGIDI
ncbi:MAG: R3H domain-containing nucleic acid-binding protein [Candidatus Gracilibacteria bacterium]